MLLCVGAQLISENQGLLVVDVILLSVARVIITSMIFTKGSHNSSHHRLNDQFCFLL